MRLLLDAISMYPESCDLWATENAADNGYFRVNRSGTSGAVVVSYSVDAASTAATGGDYTALPGSVTIPNGSTYADIPVTVLNDSLVESYETVRITLTGTNLPSTYPITSYAKTACLVIRDDESLATTLPANPVKLTEALDTIGVNIAVTGDSNENAAMTMQYRLSGTSTWYGGQDGIRTQAYYRNSDTPNLELATRLFHLTPGTTYDVKVTLSDPNGVTGTNPYTFTATTLSEPTVTSFGTNYYVDYARGSDSYTSAQAQNPATPWKTIDKAEDYAVANTTIYLMPGEHEVPATVTFDQNGSAAQPIVIKSYDPNNPGVVRGPKSGYQWNAGTTWTNENATYSGVYSVSMTNTPSQVFYGDVYLGQCDTVSNLVNGKCSNGGTLYDIGTDGGWSYDATARKLYIKIPTVWNAWSGTTVNPTTGTVTAVKSGLNGVDVRGKYLVFDDLVFRYFTADLYARIAYIAGQGNNLTVRNCSFENSGAGFSVYTGSDNTQTQALHDVLIDHCRFRVGTDYVYRNWTLGHDVYDTEGVNISDVPDCTGTIRNCTFEQIENGIGLGWGAGAGHAENMRGWVLENNRFDNVGDDCMEPEGNLYNLAILNNTMLHGHSAISLAPCMCGPTWVIGNNIYFTDRINPDGKPDTNDEYVTPINVFKFNSGYNQPGPYMSVLAYHNSILIDTTVGTIAAGITAWPRADGINFIGRNNSFTTLAYGDRTHRASAPTDINSRQYIDLDYDSTFNAGAGIANLWTTPHPTSTTYDTFAQFRAGGYETHGIYFMPSYANPNSGDFSVPYGTWLQDGGVFLPGIEVGSTGAPNYQGAAPDIGSYEAPGAAPTRYALTVVDGTGDGDWAEGSVVQIVASVPAGASFAAWTGDTQSIADVYSPTTTLTMPNHPVTITATFQAAVYTVGATGQQYTTVQAAVNAAKAFNADATIRIMDSGTYNEYVSVGLTGYAGRTLTIEPASGQTPKLYGINNASSFNVVVSGLTIDGTLRPYATDATAQDNLIYFRYGGSDAIKNCTIRGRGKTFTIILYGDAGTTMTFSNNVFESSTLGISTYDAPGGAVITGNQFNGCPTGIMWSRSSVSSPVIISGNLFNQCTSAGFYRRIAAVGSNITLENNTFYKCGGTTDYANAAILVRDFSGQAISMVIKDNVIYGKNASGQYDGINGYSDAITKINADYNGFYGLYSGRAAYLGGAWKSVSQLNSYVDASNNVLGATDPFVDAAHGNFRPAANSWILTAASDGSYLGAMSPIAGDANGDGIVDQADYTSWYNSYGATGATWRQGDFNFDGMVDQADYTTWYNNYGASGGSAAPAAASVVLSLAPDDSVLAAGTVANEAPTGSSPAPMDVSPPAAASADLPKSAAPAMVVQPARPAAPTFPGRHRAPRPAFAPAADCVLGDTGLFDALTG